jgi:Lrp/AsnC family leucine-responsive transcriptional regulator
MQKEKESSKPARPLDRIDLKIVEALRKNARITFQALSEQVALSPRPCQERVRRLERSGIIRGYTAIVDLPEERARIHVIAHIAMRDQAISRHGHPFENALRKCAEVVQCSVVSGEYDYIVRVSCRSLDEYRQLIDSWLVNKRFGVAKIVSAPELQVIKPGER